jgi:manganese/zinc/iron transport system substrate-binding protein
MVTDLVKEVGGPRVEVEGLMGAGVDPHLYKPTCGRHHPAAKGEG